MEDSPGFGDLNWGGRCRRRISLGKEITPQSVQPPQDGFTTEAVGLTDEQPDQSDHDDAIESDYGHGGRNSESRECNRESAQSYERRSVAARSILVTLENRHGVVDVSKALRRPGV